MRAASLTSIMESLIRKMQHRDAGYHTPPPSEIASPTYLFDFDIGFHHDRHDIALGILRSSLIGKLGNLRNSEPAPDTTDRSRAERQPEPVGDWPGEYQESITSRTPPKPGTVAEASLRSQSRLIIDSIRSPSWATAPTISPKPAACGQSSVGIFTR